MSGKTATRTGQIFRVLDAMDAPHTGRILRLRLESGEPPAVRSLKGSEMIARSLDGDECRVRVLGFAVFGGKARDERLARTGRIDVHIEELGPGGPVDLRWEVRPA